MKRTFWHIFVEKIKKNSPYPELVALLCAAGVIFCSYVLILWNTIPVYDYYIDAEYICPDSVREQLETKISVFVEPNGMLNSYSVNKSEAEKFVISIEDTTSQSNKSDKADKSHIYRSYEAEQNVSKKLKYYTNGLYDDTIHTLLSQAHIINQDPDRLFFFHLYSCGEHLNLLAKADTNVSYYVHDTLAFTHEWNQNYCISILDRSIDTIYHSRERNTSFLSDNHLYTHLSALKIANNNDPFTNYITVSTQRTTFRKNKIQTLLMPKDISRAYYKVSFLSGTIPTYTLRFNFVQGVVLENMPYNCTYGVNSVEFPNVATSRVHGHRDMKIYAAFPDGENMQTVRTFFIAIIITWLLKEFIKALYKAFVKYANIIHNKFSK